ncbi:MAG: helix-turn-helix domain-containing protein [Candidatus Pacearchaeota archaeon]
MAEFNLKTVVQKEEQTKQIPIDLSIVKSYILETTNPTMIGIANALGLKLRTFYRKINDLTYQSQGKSYRLNLKGARDNYRILEVLKHIRANSNKTIEEISKDLGFCDIYYFDKWFGRKIRQKRITPKEYQLMESKEAEKIKNKYKTKLEKCWPGFSKGL